MCDANSVFQLGFPGQGLVAGRPPSGPFYRPTYLSDELEELDDESADSDVPEAPDDSDESDSELAPVLLDLVPEDDSSLEVAESSSFSWLELPVAEELVPLSVPLVDVELEAELDPLELSPFWIAASCSSSTLMETKALLEEARVPAYHVWDEMLEEVGSKTVRDPSEFAPTTSTQCCSEVNVSALICAAMTDVSESP